MTKIIEMSECRCDANKCDNRKLIESIGNVIKDRCTCGGRGPEDPEACPACLIWFDLTHILKLII